MSLLQALQPAALDGGAAWSPWVIGQSATLPRPVAPTTVKPLIPNPVPQPVAPWQGGTPVQVQGAPTSIIPYVPPQLAQLTGGDNVTASPVDGAGTGGCLVCASSPSRGTSTTAAAIVGPSRGTSASPAPAASLLSATSDAFPWWWLVLAGAAVTVLLDKVGDK